MTEFEREMPAFRLALTRFGDTLQTIAARELGDSNRWPELVWVNLLKFPYITDDERLAGPGVLLSGAMIKVPAPAGFITTDATERGQVYERDCKMQGRQLQAVDGDFAVITGADNLRQQLTHRVATPRGQAQRHPQYGCMLYRLVGRSNGPTAARLGSDYVRSCLEGDYRVKSVQFADAEVRGDTVRVQARAIAIEGGIVDILQGGA